ncbi:MAG: type I methionyl aminopeptidase [Oscillospiraceae bacterium]|nr:type I methionyl aminopeptidase [Oscillospiraceae bacterium]
MAIVIKSQRDIDLMRKAGRIAAGARSVARQMVEPGVTTKAINKEVFHYIKKSGAEPTFLGYGGFPASVCISVNEQVIHGIPGSRKLKEGDIVSIDVGATYRGFVGDCAMTVPCGQCSDEALRLIRETRQSFFEGIRYARSGNRVSDISAGVQTYIEARGFSLVRDYVGHGVGAKMHEEPEVPNFVDKDRKGGNPRLMPCMTIAVEPMVNAGVWQVKVLDDGWTVVTADGKLSAHYENSILITDGEPEILTMSDDL